MGLKFQDVIVVTRTWMTQETNRITTTYLIQTIFEFWCFFFSFHFSLSFYGKWGALMPSQVVFQTSLDFTNGSRSTLIKWFSHSIPFGRFVLSKSLPTSSIGTFSSPIKFPRIKVVLLQALSALGT